MFLDTKTFTNNKMYFKSASGLNFQFKGKLWIEVKFELWAKHFIFLAFCFSELPIYISLKLIFTALIIKIWIVMNLSGILPFRLSHRGESQHKLQILQSQIIINLNFGALKRFLNKSEQWKLCLCMNHWVDYTVFLKPKVVFMTI